VLLLSENVPNLNSNDRSTCKLLFGKRDHPFPGYILFQGYRVLLSPIPPALSTFNPTSLYTIPLSRIQFNKGAKEEQNSNGNKQRVLEILSP
jgi:hypothetical protein